MIVMKFGGTSVEDSTAIDRAAKIVCGRLPQDPVVVVSAMAKVTDQLLAMARAAGGGDRDSALQLSRAVRERHYNAASELLGTSTFSQIHSELEAEFDALDELLRGIAAVGELTPRTTDNVTSYGERLSSKLVTEAFGARGLKAALVDARECIITDASFTKAVPLIDDTNDNLQARLRPLLDKKRVPVLGGFIAATRDGITTTIGRGGSDFSAALIGAALEAERIEIWTDVDGILTADPRLVPAARLVPEVSSAEAAELAFFGAKVLHPATIRPAVARGIPVHVRNSFRPEAPGTVVRREAPGAGVRAIAMRPGVTAIFVGSPRMLLAHGYAAKVFSVFEKHRVSVDVIATSEVSISITVDERVPLAGVVRDLAEFAEVSLLPHLAVVSVVGRGLRATAGIAVRVFGALGDVNVVLISQGASDTNMTFVVDANDAPEALRRLHRELFE